MSKLMKKTFLVGLGVISLVGERIKKVVDELSEKGEVTKAEITETTRNLEKKIEQNRPVTRQDIERLEQKLEELKQKS